MFVVAGITGHTGAAAANTLLANGKSVRAFVRDPAKAKSWADRGVSIVKADILDAKALAGVLDGAEGAYNLIPPDPANPDPIGYSILAATAIRSAARTVKLPKLVHLSSMAAQHALGTGPIRGAHIAEAILADAAPQVTFLRAASFHENWQPMLGLAAAQGILPTFLKDLDAKYATVATADIGRVAAEQLLEASAPRIVELSGPELASARDAAAAFSAVLGKPVQPVQPPRDQWVGILQGAGLGQGYAELLAEMNDGINSGHVRLEGKVPLTRGRQTLAQTVASWPKPNVS
jgi:uncharacterized protein YbjT (DUF2867 family)